MKLLRSKKNRSLVVAALLICTPSLAGQTKTPEQSAKEFYQWYFRELNANRQPHKQRARMNNFISARLSSWYFSKAYSEWGADYFIDGQDYEPKWANNIAPQKAVIRGNRAMLKVRLISPSNFPFPSRTLDVQMVKEANRWKLDRVNNYVIP
jgi:hypothetical protein